MLIFQHGLAQKFLAQPQPRLCTLLDLLWTFLEEAALCDVLEHCVVRQYLLFDLVSPVSDCMFSPLPAFQPTTIK